MVAHIGVVDRTGGAGVVVDFDDFYRATFASMVALAVAVSGQRAGAEDVVQEAMLDAHRRWDRIGSYESPRGWLRRVVVQRSTKASRKRSNELAAARRSVGMLVDEPAAPGLDPTLLAALLELSDQQRAVVALHYLEDLSVAETAVVLGVADGTVKTQLARARIRLAALLDVEEDTDG